MRDTSDPLDAPPELLRVATAGSVDDGKSTLIGRLLHDTRSILDDQLDAVELTSRERGDGRLDLALLTDGLRAEREQGITIDVAYRFFATAAPLVHPRRHARPRPLHAQHGHRRLDRRRRDRADRRPPRRRRAVQAPRLHRLAASRAAPRRLREQDGPRRLGRARVRSHRRRLRRLRPPRRAARRGRRSRSRRSTATTSSSARRPRPGTTGPPLLEYLEDVDVAADRRVFGAARLPVQWVIRPHDDAHHDYRGHAGQVAGGVLRAGRRGRRAAAERPHADRAHRHASTARSRRRSRRCRSPCCWRTTSTSPAATCCARPTRPRRWRATCAPTSAGSTTRPRGRRPRYLIKHTTRTTRAELTRIEHRVEVESLRTESDPRDARAQRHRPA